MNPAHLLLTLQSKDVEFLYKRRDLKQLQERIEARGGLPDMQKTEEKARANVLSARLTVARLESDIAEYEEKMTSANERLYSGSITNEREVQALKTEYDTAKQNFEGANEEVVRSKSTLETEQERLENISQQVREIEENWESQREEFVKTAKKISEELTALAKERQEVSANVAPEFLRRYSTLMRVTKGVAVAKISRSTCQGCNVRLPVGEVTRAKSLKSLTFCSNCGRILLQE